MANQSRNTDFWTDPDGNRIAAKNVRDIDRRREEVVFGLVDEAKRIAGTLEEFRQRALDTVDAFYEESARALKAKPGGKKRNPKLASYDDTVMVTVSKANLLAFDERLNIAKDLIDRFMKERLSVSDVDEDIVSIISAAFDLEGDGRPSIQRILSLKKLDIDKPLWKKAMEAVAQAVRVKRSKRYIRFHERPEGGGKHRQIPLDIAAYEG